MCKFIKRIVCLVIFGALILFVIAILRGGEPFRWFGKKSEETGKMIQKKSGEMAEEADRLKETGDKIKDEAERVEKTTKEILKR
jgi:hypothetical protein